MSKVIAGAAAALIATMLTTAPAGAIDLSGGTLRGAKGQGADAATMSDLAALDIGDPVGGSGHDRVRDADDQLDAMAKEEAALGIERSASFVPIGGERMDGEGEWDEDAVIDDTTTLSPDAEGGMVGGMEGDMEGGMEGGIPAEAGTDLATYLPKEPYVESIPVLSPVAQSGFRPATPRASTSVQPLGSWGRGNPRASTVVLGGSWEAR